MYKDSVYNNDLEKKLAEERTKQNIEAEQDARKKAELEASLLSTQNQLFGVVAAALLLIRLVAVESRKRRKNVLFPSFFVFFLVRSAATNSKKALKGEKMTVFAVLLPTAAMSFT